MTEKLSIEEARLVADNLARVRTAIADACAVSGRKEDEVTLMAVTKTVSAEKINAAIAAGVTDIGENRVQEYLQKREALLLDGVRTHLIGHLQTNKVEKIIGTVDMIQSVDSVRLAHALDAAATKKGIVCDVLVEVNVGEEEAKSGVSPSEAIDFVENLCEFSALRVRGLMTVPPISDTEYEKRRYFSILRKLFVDIRDKKSDNRSMDILSMGMSADFREAILEGATMVRVGSAIFGQRQYNTI